MRFVRVIEPNVGGDFGITADGTRYNGHALKEWRTSPVPEKEQLSHGSGRGTR